MYNTISRGRENGPWCSREYIAYLADDRCVSGFDRDKESHCQQKQDQNCTIKDHPLIEGKKAREMRRENLAKHITTPWSLSTDTNLNRCGNKATK